MSELQRALDRIDELEELLGVHVIVPQLGLTPLEAKFVGFLMRKEIANQGMIHTAVYGGLPECDQPDTKTIDVHICNIRKKLAPQGLSIKTRYNVGYYFDPASRAALKSLCEGVRV